MRLVLDTNVVASGLLWQGTPARLLDAAATGQGELFTSRWLLAELNRILRRPKFDKAIAAGGVTLAELILGYAALTTVVMPESIPSVISDDPDDDHVLACALAANANLIVSGDRHLLNLKTFVHKPIVRPAEGVRIINSDLFGSSKKSRGLVIGAQNFVTLKNRGRDPEGSPRFYVSDGYEATRFCSCGQPMPIRNGSEGRLVFSTWVA